MSKFIGTVYIESCGVVSPAGYGIESCSRQALNEASSIQYNEEGVLFGLLSGRASGVIGALAVELSDMAFLRNHLLGLAASRLAYEEALQPAFSQAKVIWSSAFGELAYHENQVAEFLENSKSSLANVASPFAYSIASLIASELRSSELSLELRASMTGGAQVLLSAVEYMSLGGQRVLVGGSDSFVTPYASKWFESKGLKTKQPSALFPHRPYGGKVEFSVGEGAAAAILTRAPSDSGVRITGIRVHSLDWSSGVTQEEQLINKSKLCKELLEEFFSDIGIDESNIDLVITNGAGIPKEDQLELNVLTSVFSPTMPFRCYTWQNGLMMAANFFYHLGMACQILKTGEVGGSPCIEHANFQADLRSKRMQRILIVQIDTEQVSAIVLEN